jgi:hypothetical protein
MAWKDVFFINFFSKVFVFNTINSWTNFYYLPHQYASHFFSIEFRNFNWLNWIIQFKLHAMSLSIFIWIEPNFHKINAFQLISWLSFVIHNMKAKHIDINVTNCNNLHILSNKWPSLYFTLPMTIYWCKVKIFRVWNHFHFHYFRTINLIFT